jgi:hypothetical protein
MSLKPPAPGSPGFKEWLDLADAVDAAGVLGAGGAASLPEPDCWAILTPNGSKLVSPDEAKGSLAAYPLYTAAQMRATACPVAAPLSDDDIDAIARRHGTSLNTHDARLLFSKMRWRAFAREVLAAAHGVALRDGGKTV